MRTYIIYIYALISLLSINLVQGQQTYMTKIKDGTVAQSSSVPSEAVILELESTNKGFLAPRMTTVQRDVIDKTKLKDGLLIFNTTTGCINYWSGLQDTWLSVCGTPPPAEIALTPDQCTSIITEPLQQGVTLTELNKMNIPVTVTVAGVYDIIVKSTNGYYFYASGRFPTEGDYNIILQGIGTPLRGYEPGEQGDVLTMILNGKTRICKPVVFVKEQEMSFDMKCNTISVGEDLFLGMPLTIDNKITIDVVAHIIGTWNVTSNTVNGLSYFGKGKFETTGPQKIELIGRGIPTTVGSTELILTSNSTKNNTSCPVTISVKSVKYEIVCEDINIEGNYQQDVALDKSNVINVPVKVLAPGKTTISTTTVNGVSFSSGEVELEFNEVTNDIQIVALFSNDATPQVVGDYNFKITGDVGAVSPCDYKITVAPQAVNYTILCNDIRTQGVYAPKVPMDKSNKLAVTVDVKYVGDYELSTEVVNGIRYEGKGTFTSTGKQVIYLPAYGEPIETGKFSYHLTSNSNALSGNISCDFFTIAVIRKMNILVTPNNTASSSLLSANIYTAGVIMRNMENFGTKDNSVVQVEGLNMIGTTLTTPEDLRNIINQEKIDIIWLTFGAMNASYIDVLTEFVNNKKGVLLLNQERDIKDVSMLIDKIGNASAGTTKYSNVITQSNLISNIDDPILNGSFGDIRNKYFGVDYFYGYCFSNLPLGQYNVLSTKIDDPTWAFGVKHKTKGFAVVGDNGWMSGYTDQKVSRTASYPSTTTIDGKPLTTPKYFKVSEKINEYVPVENSFFMANMMEWAINFAQSNVDQDYQMTGRP
ncbi:hypothetical protein [Myroides marinus]|uniref:hypothetical protein n=1 Tax=Myroides marinus TaxID=703342 RepID=UPI00257562EE|nr:hypothetical protein [Myroides marinus]MDM1362197.1 hypothetical protein [Myroides marinus]